MELNYKGTLDEFNAVFRLPLADWHTEVISLLNEVKSEGTTIMANQAQHAADLTAIKDQVTKSKGEILKKVADLEAAVVAAGNTSEEVNTAMEALKAEVQGVDDLNPDAAVGVDPGTAETI